MPPRSSVHGDTANGSSISSPACAAAAADASEQQQAVLSLLLALRSTCPPPPTVMSALPHLGSSTLLQLEERAVFADSMVPCSTDGTNATGWPCGTDISGTSSIGGCTAAASLSVAGLPGCLAAGRCETGSRWVSAEAAALQLLQQVPLDIVGPPKVMSNSSNGLQDGTQAGLGDPALAGVLPVLDYTQLAIQLASTQSRLGQPLGTGVSNVSRSNGSAACNPQPSSHQTRISRQPDVLPACSSRGKSHAAVVQGPAALGSASIAVSDAAVAAAAAAAAVAEAQPEVRAYVQLASAEPGSGGHLLLGPLLVDAAADADAEDVYGSSSAPVVRYKALGRPSSSSDGSSSSLSRRVTMEDDGSNGVGGGWATAIGSNGARLQQPAALVAAGVAPAATSAAARDTVAAQDQQGRGCSLTTSGSSKAQGLGASSKDQLQSEAELVAASCLAVQGVWSAVQHLWSVAVADALPAARNNRYVSLHVGLSSLWLCGITCAQG